jgi:hypothetical protein
MLKSRKFLFLSHTFKLPLVLLVGCCPSNFFFFFYLFFIYFYLFFFFFFHCFPLPPFLSPSPDPAPKHSCFFSFPYNLAIGLSFVHCCCSFVKLPGTFLLLLLLFSCALQGLPLFISLKSKTLHCLKFRLFSASKKKKKKPTVSHLAHLSKFLSPYLRPLFYSLVSSNSFFLLLDIIILTAV